VDETGRISLDAARGLAGRDRITELLAAARAGDTAARAEVLAAARLIIRTVVDTIELGPADQAAVFRTVSRRIAGEITESDSESTLLQRIVTVVKWEAIPRRPPSSEPRVLPDYVPDPQKRALATGSVPRLTQRERRLLWALTTNASYQAISAELGIPVGSIALTRARLFRKLWRLADSEASPRAALEAVLRSHALTDPPKRRERRRGLLRRLGLTAPERPSRTSSGDRVVAAVQDITGAGRDVLREFADVLAMSREEGDRT
jgi:DNA-binding NarL/FixJ family response regulator